MNGEPEKSQGPPESVWIETEASDSNRMWEAHTGRPVLLSGPGVDWTRLMPLIGCGFNSGRRSNKGPL